MTFDSADATATSGYYHPLIAFGAPSELQIVGTTDVATPAARWRNVVRQDWANVLVPSTVVEPQAKTEPADTKWFSEALSKLATWKNSYRDVATDVAVTAEYLIANFAVWPAERRPDLLVDEEGRPHFTAKSRNYYLHLTVEDDASLNWYAKLDDQEIMGDEDRLVGAVLPSPLLSFSSI